MEPQEGQDQFPILGGLYMMPTSYDPAAMGMDQLQTAPVQMELYSGKLQELDQLFMTQRDEIERMTLEELKNHNLPLARVKKIMKSDEDVRMISAEAPALFAKACELFIVELSFRAWVHTEESRRRTLHRSDVAQCISRTDIFDFLLDIVPSKADS
jgi:nuclear transcription factor Y gamma